jgi:hypothetical protein
MCSFRALICLSLAALPVASRFFISVTRGVAAGSLAIKLLGDGLKVTFRYLSRGKLHHTQHVGAIDAFLLIRLLL